VDRITEAWCKLFSCDGPGKIDCVALNYRDHATESL